MIFERRKSTWGGNTRLKQPDSNISTEMYGYNDICWKGWGNNRNAIMGIIHCLRYILYARRFGSPHYSRLQELVVIVLTLLPRITDDNGWNRIQDLSNARLAFSRLDLGSGPQTVVVLTLCMLHVQLSYSVAEAAILKFCLCSVDSGAVPCSEDTDTLMS